MPGFDRAFFFLADLFDETLTTADCASDIFQPDASIAPAGYGFAEDIAAFDDFADPIANLAWGPSCAATPMAPPLYFFLLYTLLVLPHG